MGAVARSYYVIRERTPIPCGLACGASPPPWYLGRSRSPYWTGTLGSLRLNRIDYRRVARISAAETLCPPRLAGLRTLEPCLGLAPWDGFWYHTHVASTSAVPRLTVWGRRLFVWGILAEAADSVN